MRPNSSKYRHRLLRNIFSVVLLAGLISSPGWSEDLAVMVSRTAPAYMVALQNFTEHTGFTYRVFNIEGDIQKGADIMQTFTPRDYKAVVTIGGEVTSLIGKLNPELPVIYSMVFSPVAEKRASLSGVYIKIEFSEQLKYMKKILPDKNRIGVMYSPEANGHAMLEARSVATDLDLRLMPIAVSEVDEVSMALSKLADNVDIIWMIVDPVIGRPDAVSKIMDYIQTQKMLLFGFSQAQVKAGAFAAFAVDYANIGQQTADVVRQVNIGEIKNVQQGPKKIIVYVNAALQKKMTGSLIETMPEIEWVQ